MLDLKALPSDICALVFDCDGTLVDTPSVYARAWATGFRSSGKEMTLEWYLAQAGMSEHVLMDAFEAEMGVELDRDQVVRLMRAAFFEGSTELRDIEAISAIARQNRGRLRMAVASGGPEAIVLPTLQVTGLMPLFDAVVTIEDVGHAPSPHSTSSWRRLEG
jgi:beta-phosphoglucomutase-like phosphatase (HAD superfamily)